MTGRWTRGALSLGSDRSHRRGARSHGGGRVDARGGASAAKTVNVGFIYPKTGGSRAFGQEEYDGFQAGLAYTKGKCGGYTINPTYVDDATDPATAITAFKNLVGQGIKIIAGTGSSGIALQLGPLAAQNNVLYIAGAAAADAITGLNRNTFRAGRQTLQDVLDAANIFPPKSTGKKIVVFAEDTAFGAGQRRGGAARSSAARATPSRRSSSPFGAADLTPYAQQLKNSGADAAFVAWANTTNAAAMWQALQQQGVPKQMTIVTGLANRESYDAIGPLVQGVTLISHYVYQAPHNAVNTYMIKWHREEPPRRAEHLHAGRLRHGADDLPRARRRAARTPRSRSARSRAGSSSRRRASSASAPRTTRCCSRCSRCSSSRAGTATSSSRC